MISQFKAANSRLRTAASYVYYLDLKNTPELPKPDRTAYDMSPVPDELTCNLRGAVVRSNYEVKWRPDLEYLPCNLVGSVFVDNTDIRGDSWVNAVMASENKVRGYEDYYISVLYFDIDPTVDTKRNFMFMYSMAIVTGKPRYLVALDKYIRGTNWGSKQITFRGIRSS